MKIGVFGGSFDPIHLGHLLLAESCREAARLDQIWFIPAAISPHKQSRKLAAASHRLRMLKLAINGHPNFHVSEIELQRGGVSYTVDTLEWIRERHPEAEIFLLMGGDSLADLPRWRSPERICELALPLVVRRTGAPEPCYDGLEAVISLDRLQQIRQATVQMPLIELSSTDLRQRIAEGRSIRFRTPEAVEIYIRSQELYRESH